MVHGLGAGGALFALSFEELAKHSTVYCIDLPGIIKSVRQKINFLIYVNSILIS